MLLVAAGRPDQPLAPAQACLGGGRRFVLAANPTVVANPVDVRKKKRVVDLSGPWLVASRIVRDLDMPDARQVLLQGRGELSLHPLRVVDVVLEEGVVGANRVEDAERLVSA